MKKIRLWWLGLQIRYLRQLEQDYRESALQNKCDADEAAIRRGILEAKAYSLVGVRYSREPIADLIGKQNGQPKKS